jgi:hypothetical protein
MRITVVKWVSIGLLLLTLLFWTSFSSYGLAVELFVAFAAGLAGIQALRERKATWAAAFLLVTLYFSFAAAAGVINPRSPAIRLGGFPGALAIVFSIGVFTLSFFAIRNRPRMSLVPIPCRTSGSEAL